MKKGKRTTSILVVFTIILSSIFAVAAFEPAEYYTLTFGSIYEGNESNTIMKEITPIFKFDVEGKTQGMYQSSFLATSLGGGNSVTLSYLNAIILEGVTFNVRSVYLKAGNYYRKVMIHPYLSVGNSIEFTKEALGITNDNGLAHRISHLSIYPENLERVNPTPTPTENPTSTPSSPPTPIPTEVPTGTPCNPPTTTPHNTPSSTPNSTPTPPPGDEPTQTPDHTPIPSSSEDPTPTPSVLPTFSPTQEPTATPSDSPTSEPTMIPTVAPTNTPTPHRDHHETQTPSPSPTTPSPGESATTSSPSNSSSGIGGSGLTMLFYSSNSGPTRMPAGILYDVGIDMNSDKSSYMQGEIIVYTLNYQNNTNAEMGPISIRATIPAHTNIYASNGGKVTERQIEWTMEKLLPSQKGNITFEVQVGTLPEPEIKASNECSITALQDKVENPEDDRASLSVLLYKQDPFIGAHRYYIVGYPDKNFKPVRPISRAEIATIFTRLLGIYNPTLGKLPYADVNANHWAAGFISTATTEFNLFVGNSGLFRPDEPITMAELATVMCRFAKKGYPLPYLLDYEKDKSHWSMKFVTEAFQTKFRAPSIQLETYLPNETISREQVVVILNRFLSRGPLKRGKSTFPDVMLSHPASGQVEETASDHEYTNDPAGSEVQVN